MRPHTDNRTEYHKKSSYPHPHCQRIDVDGERGAAAVTLPAVKYHIYVFRRCHAQPNLTGGLIRRLIVNVAAGNYLTQKSVGRRIRHEKIRSDFGMVTLALRIKCRISQRVAGQFDRPPSCQSDVRRRLIELIADNGDADQHDPKVNDIAAVAAPISAYQPPQRRR